MDRSDIKTNAERRLQSMGVLIKPSDDWILNFIIDKVGSCIKNNCNIQDIPDDLLYVTVDMVCGEYLKFKKNSGELDPEKFNFDMVQKSIQEGDTKVEFYVDGTQTKEQRFDSFVNSLISGHKEDLESYRQIKW